MGKTQRDLMGERSKLDERRKRERGRRGEKRQKDTLNKKI